MVTIETTCFNIKIIIIAITSLNSSNHCVFVVEMDPVLSYGRVWHAEYPNFRLQVFWALSSNGKGFSPITLPFSGHYYSTSVPKSSSVTCYPYEDKQANQCFFAHVGGGGIRQKITFILGFIAVSWFRLNSTSYRRSPGSVPLPLCQTCGRESNIGTRLSQCSSVSRHIHSTSTQYSFLSSFSSYPKDKQAKSGNFQLEQFSFGNRENCNFSHHRSFYLPLNYHLLHLPLFFSGFIVSYTTEIWTELTEIRQEV